MLKASIATRKIVKTAIDPAIVTVLVQDHQDVTDPDLQEDVLVHLKDTVVMIGVVLDHLNAVDPLNMLVAAKIKTR